MVFTSPWWISSRRKFTCCASCTRCARNLAASALGVCTCVLQAGIRILELEITNAACTMCAGAGAAEHHMTRFPSFCSDSRCVCDLFHDSVVASGLSLRATASFSACACSDGGVMCWKYKRERQNEWTSFACTIRIAHGFPPSCLCVLPRVL